MCICTNPIAVLSCRSFGSQMSLPCSVVVGILPFLPLWIPYKWLTWINEHEISTEDFFICHFRPFDII